jgi:cyclophilin family peptidyl-prolyl cis-trans isomerase/tRNA A-37 threonylcarbamoyl transferase component Bud32
MARWKVWLRCLGEAVWQQTPKALIGLLPFGERLYDLATDFRNRLEKAEQAPAERAAAVVELVTASPAEIETEAQRIASSVAQGQPADVQQKLTQYLQLVPLFTQQSLRRPEDPSGKSLPPRLSLDDPRDLAAIIPPVPPRFRPGDSPPGMHGWVLVKRLGAGGFGEVWQARHPQAKNVFAAVKFCLDEKARQVLLHEKHVIDQVMSLGALPTIVPLQDFNLDADPPYLKYQFIPGGDLLEFATYFYGVKATAAIRNVAETVGRFHRLQPPVVHRDLKPSNILVEKETVPGGGSRLRLRVADFGIGGMASALDQDRVRTVPSAVLPTALLGSHTALYASKQQKQGARPDPRDDVFALGVLWYQLLIGDLTSERPSGKWRKKVSALGVSEAVIDLLESCCDYDDPEERPKDAAEMAEQIAAAAQPGTSVAPPSMVATHPPSPPPTQGMGVLGKVAPERRIGAGPRVIMETSLGTIEIELDDVKAPISTANFLSYVDDRYYDGTIFHRVISTFMIQGGGFEPGMRQKPTKAPIKNESPNGLSNTRGTIATARTSNPDSATAQFYINVVDNSRGLDSQRYCVFGKVVAGMDVVDKIKAVATTNRAGHENAPRQDVVITSVRRAE